MLPSAMEFSGRAFSPDDIELIRDTVRDFSNLSLTELARTLCELLEWKRPTGKLKQEECRVLLDHLQADGLLRLPKLRPTAAPGPRKIKAITVSDPQSPVTGSTSQFESLCLHLVQPSNQTLSPIFNQLIDRYHYLGYRVPFGAHLRYVVESQQLPSRHPACLELSR
jgi:hypothetical protein